ncbi:hypothetical protein EDD15DRAFT_1288784 [Pisolithus albus]|nr:hypothetical protein EDD15DRAFT_1288784 [Pisolithus albus]
MGLVRRAPSVVTNGVSAPTCKHRVVVVEGPNLPWMSSRSVHECKFASKQRRVSPRCMPPGILSHPLRATLLYMNARELPGNSPPSCRSLAVRPCQTISINRHSVVIAAVVSVGKWPGKGVNQFGMSTDPCMIRLWCAEVQNELATITVDYLIMHTVGLGKSPCIMTLCGSMESPTPAAQLRRTKNPCIIRFMHYEIINCSAILTPSSATKGRPPSMC